MILIELLFIFEKIPSAVPLPLSLICCYNRKWPSIDAHTAKWMRLRKREAGTVQKNLFLALFFLRIASGLIFFGMQNAFY